MNIKTLLPIAGMLFYHCATAPNQHYLNFSTLTDSLKITSLEDAVSKTEVVKLSFGDTTASELSQSDPLILLGKIEKYLTNFKVFSFHGDENEVYSIEITSICDSQSSDKNIMYPLMILVDSKGNVLKQNKMLTYETITSNLSSATRIYGYQEVYIENAGDYYLLVVSDNSVQNGNSITTVYGETILKYTLKGIYGRRAPWGSFLLKINRKNN